jgi:hypothetical protein
VRDRAPHHLSAWLLLLSLLSMGCAPSVYTWPNKYEPRYKPGDDAADDSGPIRLILTADKEAMASPGYVVYTLQIRGDASACAWTKVWFAGGLASRGTCDRSQRFERPIRCLGKCTTVAAAFAEGGRSLTQQTLAIQIGGDSE